LKDRVWIADYNPFQILLEVVRRPVVEGIPSLVAYGKCLVLILILYAVTAPFFARYRSRLAFWV
jgi:ABC-type polysaccharide/polyol phosphate export permease